jgi:hypothetical protein
MHFLNKDRAENTTSRMDLRNGDAFANFSQKEFNFQVCPKMVENVIFSLLNSTKNKEI